MTGIPNGVIEAYRDALSDRRLTWASPAVFTVGAYVGFYGIGMVLSGPSPQLTVISIAVGVGLVGLLAGMGVGWKAGPGPIGRKPVDRRLLTRYGFLLLGVGLVALVAYFAKIGHVPLFQPGLEQGRVDAANEGGAPLRVLSLLALPGVWILIAQAVAARNRRWIAIAAITAAGIAFGFALTGNRSPAFTTVEIGLITGLLASGVDRVKGRGVVLLALFGVVLVLGAGLFGAYRLASHSDANSPPTPHARPPDYASLTAIAIKGYLVVPIKNLGYTMDAVPDMIDWRLGQTYIQPLLTALPGKQTTFDADLKAALNQQYSGGGTVPGLLGEAYANFGVIGWFAVPFLLGLAITALYRVSRGGPPEWAALYAFAIAHVSIGGVLSGLSVASPFPFEAFAVLGLAVIGLPVVERLWVGRVADLGA